MALAHVGYVTVGTLVLGSHVVAGAMCASSESCANSGVWPLVIASCLLITLLAIFGVIFKWMNIADVTQALALPDGSVRALLALMLVLMYALMMSTQSSRLADGRATSLIPEPEVADFMKTHEILSSTVLSLQAAKDRGCTTACRELVVRVPASASQIKFADQLLAGLGTLIASVVSFYFGSRATVSAATTVAGASTGAPSLTISAVTPAVPVDQGTAREFAIQGKGLSGATLVEITPTMTGGVPITAFAPQTHTDQEARYQFEPAPGAVAGTSYKLVLQDAAGVRTTPPQVLVLAATKSTNATGTSVPSMAVRTVTPAQRVGTGTTCEFAIQGKGLSGAKLVRITPTAPGGVPITAFTLVSQTDEEARYRFDPASNAVAGATYTLDLQDAAGKSVSPTLRLSLA